MTVYDVLIIAVIAMNVFVGGSHGFSRTLFATVALIGGILAGILLAPYASAYIPLTVSTTVKMVIAGLVIAILTMITVNTIGWWMRKTVVTGPMKVVDQFAGAVLGFVKGSAFVITIVMLALMTPFGKQIEAGTEKPYSYPLRWSVTAAKPAGAWLGGWVGSIVNKQASKALPMTVGNLTEPEVLTLLKVSDSLRHTGMSQKDVIARLNKIYSKAGVSTIKADSTVIREIVEKSEFIKSDGLSHEQIARALTVSKLPITSGALREVIGALQAVQAKGQPLEKEPLLASLTPSTRQQVEELIIILKVRSLDPETFAKETGINPAQLAHEYGLEPLYNQYKHKH